MFTSSIHKTVKVDKALHGKIIGKKAATLKDIESDYPGVKVTVPKRDDPSDLIQLSGPADAVARAEARVLDISGQLSDEAARDRGRAEALRKEKDALFDKAHKSSGQEKRRLLDAAHAKKRELELEETAAAKRIFRRKNTGYGLEQIDLHGLHVDEAMAQVKERLRRLEAGDMASVEIITGAGHHSEQNRAKIRPAVELLLHENTKLRYKPMSSGGGFEVSLVDGVSPSRDDEEGGFAGFLSAVLRFFGCASKR